MEPRRRVLFVWRSGLTTEMQLDAPLSDSTEIQLFRTPTQAPMTVTFLRRGEEFDMWVIYEEVSCMVKTQ